jgi:para-nitrobenzyl esterase
MNSRAVLGEAEPTAANFREALRRIYPDHWAEAWQLYRADTAREVVQAATDLAGDRFMGYSTWKWLTVHGKTGGCPVFQYYFARPRPSMRLERACAASKLAGDPACALDLLALPPSAGGAVHSAEIEYALGNLGLNPVYEWTPDDRRVSDTLQGYLANFIRRGDPNGAGLSHWPKRNGDGESQFMRIDVDTRAQIERRGGRYAFLDRVRA